jgi:hypothetical protein
MNRRFILTLFAAFSITPSMSFAQGFHGLIPTYRERLAKAADQHNKAIANGDASNYYLMVYVNHIEDFAIRIQKALGEGGITSITALQGAYSDLKHYHGELSRMQNFAGLSDAERNAIRDAKREVTAALIAVQKYWTEVLEYVLSDLTDIKDLTKRVPIVIPIENKK